MLGISLKDNIIYIYDLIEYTIKINVTFFLLF